MSLICGNCMKGLLCINLRGCTTGGNWSAIRNGDVCVHPDVPNFCWSTNDNSHNLHGILIFMLVVGAFFFKTKNSITLYIA